MSFVCIWSKRERKFSANAIYTRLRLFRLHCHVFDRRWFLVSVRSPIGVSVRVRVYVWVCWTENNDRRIDDFFFSWNSDKFVDEQTCLGYLRRWQEINTQENSVAFCCISSIFCSFHFIPRSIGRPNNLSFEKCKVINRLRERLTYLLVAQTMHLRCFASKIQSFVSFGVLFSYLIRCIRLVMPFCRSTQKFCNLIMFRPSMRSILEPFFASNWNATIEIGNKTKPIFRSSFYWFSSHF